MRIFLLGRQSVAKAEDIVSALKVLGHMTDFLLFPNFHYAQKNGTYETSLGSQKAPYAKTRIGYYSIHFFTILFFLMRNFRKNRYDRILAIDWFEGVMALAYRRIFARNAKVIFYSYDGYFPKRIFSAHFAIAGIERWVARHADEVWNVNETIGIEREKKGVQTKKSKTVPLGIAQKTKAWEIQNNHHFLFVGSCKEGHNLLLLAEMFSALAREEKDVRLTIVGQGNLYDEIRRKIKEKNVEKYISLRGFVEEKTLLSEIESGTYCAGIALYENTPEITCADPGKIKDYFSWGLPVLTTPYSMAIKDILAYDLGWVMKEGNFKTAIQNFSVKEALEKQMCIREFVRERSFEACLRKALEE